MNRRQFLRTTLCAGAGVLCAPMINRGRFRLFAAPADEVSARAIDLVGRSLVIDMLGLLTLDWNALWSWQSTPKGFSRNDFQKLRASGVNVFHPAVEPSDGDAHASCLRWMAGWNHLLDGRPDAFVRISTAADLARAKTEKKVGVLLGFQTADHFRTCADVALFHGLGQRVSQLTYNERNRLGSGCEAGSGSSSSGLTPFGAEIVAAMNAAGMAVDISHCGDRTSLDAVAASKKPVLITHANCRSLVAHPRCKPDEVIRKVAAGGGVMGITVIPAFVRQGRPASLHDVLDHFDHAARLAGAEHVGLGSDADVDTLDPHTRTIRPRYRVQGMAPARRVFELADGLLRRGYGESVVEGFLGGNFRRVLSEIWS